MLPSATYATSGLYDQGSASCHGNLLYWQPELTTKPGEPAELSFYTSDQAGRYMVVQGLAGDGHATTIFEVKPAL